MLKCINIALGMMDVSGCMTAYQQKPLGYLQEVLLCQEALWWHNLQA